MALVERCGIAGVTSSSPVDCALCLLASRSGLIVCLWRSKYDGAQYLAGMAWNNIKNVVRGSVGTIHMLPAVLAVLAVLSHNILVGFHRKVSPWSNCSSHIFPAAK